MYNESLPFRLQVTERMAEKEKRRKKEKEMENKARLKRKKKMEERFTTIICFNNLLDLG